METANIVNCVQEFCCEEGTERNGVVAGGGSVRGRERVALLGSMAICVIYNESFLVGRKPEWWQVWSGGLLKQYF